MARDNQSRITSAATEQVEVQRLKAQDSASGNPLPAQIGDANRSPLTRRRFLAGTGATALSFAIVKPALVFGAEANSKIDLGLIGCGGRGTWIADLFRKNGGYNVVAVADYFPEKSDSAGEKFQVAPARRFSGLSAYRKLVEQKLDAVAIISPPYFHPEQAAAAVEAGRHVYLAKPIAVDVPGCHTVEASGKKATDKRQVFLVDFQTRANDKYQTAVKLVHDGGIGRIISGEATYQTGNTWDHMDQYLREHPNDPEARIRGWGADRTLSGDVITEQNIHAIDVAAWILDAAPTRAYGTGGRIKPPVENGCWDHFAVIFYYPNDVIVSFSSKQVGKGWEDIQCRMYGMTGTIDTHYFGEVFVHCDDAYNGGKLANLYTDGVVNNIATFHKAITAGDYTNPTVEPSVRSNLTTILGRMAAYQRREVTWEEMLRANEKYEANLNGLKA